jgi:uncharacterized protein (DUF2062 family)
MILACLGVLFFRVNLPVALLACWVTNPITAVPIYLAAYRLGHVVLLAIPFAHQYVCVYGEDTRSKVVMGSFCLWTGSLILATAAAVVVNVLVRWLWPKDPSSPGR